MFKMWTVSQICGGVLLFILSGLDIKYKKVPLWLLVGGSALVVCERMLEGNVDWIILMAGASVGILFLFISKITKESLGYADSILIVTFGISLGVWDVLYLLLGAFWLAAIYAGIRLVQHKFSRRTAFPFIPFLTIAYAGMMIL